MSFITKALKLSDDQLRTKEEHSGCPRVYARVIFDMNDLCGDVLYGISVDFAVQMLVTLVARNELGSFDNAAVLGSVTHFLFL